MPDKANIPQNPQDGEQDEFWRRMKEDAEESQNERIEYEVKNYREPFEGFPYPSIVVTISIDFIRQFAPIIGAKALATYTAMLYLSVTQTPIISLETTIAELIDIDPDFSDVTWIKGIETDAQL